jgi:hypothetical protein
VRASRFVSLAVALAFLGPGAVSSLAASGSELSDEPLPLQVDKVPERPQPLEPIGPPFLGTGVIGPGFELPTGAWWQPQLLIWGEIRMGVHTFNPLGDSDTQRSQFANRVDVFAELEVSPTERVVVGFRPFDETGEFSGCVFEDPVFDEECDGHYEKEPQVLFLEGNFGELFPKLDPEDRWALDVEFAVGRQPLIFQDGFLINDTLDAVSLSRNNITLPGTTNTRVAAIYAWGEVNRGVGRAINREDGGAQLYALLVETDFPWSTVNFDIAYVDSDDRPSRGSSLHAGLSFIQRIGKLATSFRVLVSENFDDAQLLGNPSARDGVLVFGELNFVPPRTHNNLYVTYFAGAGEFSSAARGPAAGGPLGLTGLLFGAVELGTYGAPLTSVVDDATGGAIGYQMFFDNNRRWITAEFGGRYNWNGDVRTNDGGGGVALSIQQALFRRFVLRADTFGVLIEGEDPGWGARGEIRMRF